MKRFVGALFISTAAMIHALKYVNVSLMSIALNGHGTIEREANANMPGALEISIALLIGGIVYLIWAEAEEYWAKYKEKQKDDIIHR